MSTPVRRPGWTRWTRILEAEVDPDALRLLADADAPLREPGATPSIGHEDATAEPGAVVFGFHEGAFGAPRAVHFDLDADPVGAWGCHRWLLRDRLLGPWPLVFVLGGFFWSWRDFPTREAIRIVQAAGGRVLAQAQRPHH